MKPHSWITEEVDGGSLGIEDFWVCSECGASGGPVWSKYSPSDPFLANGSGLSLVDDCDESLRLIEAFNLGMECAIHWQKR